MQPENTAWPVSRRADASATCSASASAICSLFLTMHASAGGSPAAGIGTVGSPFDVKDLHSAGARPCSDLVSARHHQPVSRPGNVRHVFQVDAEDVQHF